MVHVRRPVRFGRWPQDHKERPRCIPGATNTRSGAGPTLNSYEGADDGQEYPGTHPRRQVTPKFVRIRREDHTADAAGPCPFYPQRTMSPRGFDTRPYDEWFPEQEGMTVVAATEIKPGTVVAWNYLPLLIVRTEEINLANWKPSFVQSWEAAGKPDPATWEGRPLYIHNKTDRTKDPVKLGTTPASWKWLVLPKYYSVCSHCGELPPCREAFMDRVMAVESTRIDFEMRLTHGTCHGCGQAVKPREHSILFPGENLIRPDLGSNTAVFHTRQSCLPLALAYQERWLTADDSRVARLGPHGTRPPQRREQMM